MDLVQSCGQCWVFYWHIECSTFTASTFRIWNSSTGIPSPPTSFVRIILPKAHLTSHSRMSGSRWVITPSWLSGLWRYFLYSSSVYSCHLFLISSAFVRSILFLSFIVLLFAWNVPLVSLIFFFFFSFIFISWKLITLQYCSGFCHTLTWISHGFKCVPHPDAPSRLPPSISNFLEAISSLSHSIVFLYFFALITEEGFHISPCYSLDPYIQMGISFLFSFAFCFSSFLSYL